MQPPTKVPLRTECPPGLCDCGRDALLADPRADMRILMLTREQEKELIARIERVNSYADLNHVAELMQRQLGVVLRITPGSNEVRTVRGFQIILGDLPGLCRKTRQTIPAAIRKCMERHPEIAYAVLDADSLFGQ